MSESVNPVAAMWRYARRVGRRLARALTDERWRLWLVLSALVLTMMATMIWLARLHEIDQVQETLDRTAADSVSNLRAALARNLQAVYALPTQDADPDDNWHEAANQLLRRQREVVRLEWRDPRLRLVRAEDSPYRNPVFREDARQDASSELALACASAARRGSAVYGNSYFQALQAGFGLELMDVCQPHMLSGRLIGYAVATYSLRGLLLETVDEQVLRHHEVALNDPDGTRLSAVGEVRAGAQMFAARHMFDVTGVPLMLQIHGWRRAPDVIPNVMTGVVTFMSIALVTVMVMLSRDIRLRGRAERSLEEAYAFRTAMEDSLSTGLRARDMQGRITYANPAFARMVGFSPEELLGKGDPAPYWPPDQWAEYARRLSLRRDGHLPPRDGFETEFMRKGGERFPVLVMEAPLISGTGRQTGWMSAVIDLTEQRKAEALSRATQERLQASARLASVGEMASMLSHELNQPLAVIASYANGSVHLLKSRQHDETADELRRLLAEVQVAMQRIAEQSARAGKVINTVRDFVQRRSQSRRAVTPRTLYEAISSLVLIQARNLDVRMVANVPAHLPAVLCNRTMVEQVLLNLTRNAMQAMEGMEPRGTCTLTASYVAPPCVADGGVGVGPAAGRGWVEFCVADEGPGISPELAAKLFTPFFTTKPEGMGIGLGLCRTVLEQHGSELQHRPNNPRGTVFSFRLSAV
ncbi:hypothetical protein CCO03_02640 [Comamonas serinivorans]|uniref:histidine kinase n=1 Tax=Comamonas serinivorans TaxID=1082851 RepID=A0A1Y0EJX0_9BURK|nr:PAS domain-containing sensor histidine kinase [Comamonas serinivorans]ARU03728.1 hypothetical protein CCO03_02640 [Comamonas serinivorans]